MLILGMVQRFNLPYFARKCPKFRRSAKDGNYTTPEEIGEIGERQQLTTEAKRGLFYRVELLNRSNTGCGEKGHQIAGNRVKMAGAARVGKWRSKSNAGGKYLLNKKAQNK